ncbi:pilin [Celerinatantimonas yamalensis]|uniref:Prepilin-type N-terminal cleavage/methylation domain-containing protein n=1 Tax=Celerinatantimonas yamalensis TaxID=559956 RepID=A0ABW9G5D8_9GAMM
MPGLAIRGFTLIELMITLAIVATLATLAMPVYQGYMGRARFSGVIAAAEPVKTALEVCIQSHYQNDDVDELADKDPCIEATQAFTIGDTSAHQHSKSIKSLVVSHNAAASNGQTYTIAITAQDLKDSEGKNVDYQLVGTINKQTGGVSWKAQGSCTQMGWC